jgi:hypothetical protein
LLITSLMPEPLLAEPSDVADLRRGARLRSGRVALAGWLVGDHRMAARSETRPATAE